MKTTLNLITIAVAILFTTQIYAQKSRSQSVSLTVSNEGNIECSHTAKLIVSYFYNGFGYSQISNTVSMGHHIPETLVVSIPGGATVIDRKLRIDKNSDVIIHTAGPSTEFYSLNWSNWCVIAGEPMESIYFSYLQPAYGYTEVLPYVFL